MATLLLRLSAPLQAWGTESSFDTRRTDSYPSKSGVIGMLAAALGRSRSDSVDDLNKLRFGVRVDDEGVLLRDYHTANGEKNKQYITNRYYRSDATYLVGLESDDSSFLEAIRDALLSPAYPLYLGRRSCPPTMPLVKGLREAGLADALEKEEWLLPEWKQRRKMYTSEGRLRIIVDDVNGNMEVRDVAESFDIKNRRYGWRRIKEYGYVDKNHKTEHDPMKEL